MRPKLQRRSTVEKHITLTVGVDLGDRTSQVCLLDGVGLISEQAEIRTTPAGFEQFFGGRDPLRIAIEAGTHSPWVDRTLRDLGHEVIIANPRKIALISQSTKKTDRVDAELLARVARVDAALLSPIRPRGKASRTQLTMIRARDGLVEGRVKLINMVRGLVKPTGHRLRSSSTQAFHKLVDELPECVAEILTPIMDCIGELTLRIRAYDRQLAQMAAADPDAANLMGVSGVGPVTALAFISTLEDPERFANNRDVGAYLGLCPRRSQTGLSDPELRISKAGDPYLRRLLVGSAHYILGPFGPDSDLRRWGLLLAARGGKNAKKRAAVAVARKLSVILLALWKNQRSYIPLRVDSEPEWNVVVVQGA